MSFPRQSVSILQKYDYYKTEAYFVPACDNSFNSTKVRLLLYSVQYCYTFNAVSILQKYDYYLLLLLLLLLLLSFQFYKSTIITHKTCFKGIQIISFNSTKVRLLRNCTVTVNHFIFVSILQKYDYYAK